MRISFSNQATVIPRWEPMCTVNLYLADLIGVPPDRSDPFLMNREMKSP